MAEPQRIGLQEAIAALRAELIESVMAFAGRVVAVRGRRDQDGVPDRDGTQC